MTGPPSRVPRGAIPLVLALAAFAVHGRTVLFPFVQYDDEAFLLLNPAVQEGLTWESARWALTTGMDAGRIPLTWLSRLLDVSLFGMDAGWHHGVNVLLHGANASLLYAALRRMTGRPWESAFAAALFAVHPLHVESVAWVTERKDVLSGLFWMLSLLAYGRYARDGERRCLLALHLAFLLALLSKPSVVTLPFLLLLLDYWPLRRLRLPGGGEAGEEGLPPPVPLRALLREKALLFLMAAAAATVTLLSEAGEGVMATTGQLPLWARAGNAVLAYGTYLWKAAWPARLRIFYPHPGTALPWGEVALSGAVLAAATAAVLREGRRRPWLPVGWFWFLGVLFPMIGLVQAGEFSLADRCSYLAMTGIYAALAFGAGEAVRRRTLPPAAAATAAALLLLALSVRGYLQAGQWRDSETLFRSAAAAEEGNWVAHNGLGKLAWEAGRLDEACFHLRRAVELRPGHPEARSNLGSCLMSLGRYDEAEEQLREAVRIAPDFAEAHNNLGLCLWVTGRREEGALHLRIALRDWPGSGREAVRANVEAARRGGGKEELVLVAMDTRKGRDPAGARLRYDLGVAFARRGSDAEAMGHFAEAIRLLPEFPEAHNNLGALLARQGRRDEAASHFREALRLRPGYEGARRNLERALSEGAREAGGEGR